MVLRQTNFLGQMRVDVPLLRAAESSVAADFDLAVGTIFGGKQPLVVRGFQLTNITPGSPANAIQMAGANAILVHSGATESGSMYSVPSDRANDVLSSTNSRVDGTFTSSATNFVGLDLTRSADDTTSDIVQFLGATTLLETAKTVPLARTLDYRIVITTTDFSSQTHLIPIAKVVTDSSNNITSVTDARQMAFRLADGGDFPNTTSFYSWPGSRIENTTGDVFSGGDKAILSQKDWQDAVMTRLWEIGGGEKWFSATADRNVNLIWIPPAFTNGENFEWSGTNLHWKGLRFLFDNSTGNFNNVTDITVDTPGLTNLADGECIYVDLNRASNATVIAAKATLSTLGPGNIPGARAVIAWRQGALIYTRQWRYPVGTIWIPATTTSQGVVKITRDYLGADTVGASGANDPKALSDRGGTITTPLVTNKSLVIKRFDAGLSILEWQTAGGTLLGSITNAGDLAFNSISRTISWPGLTIQTNNVGVDRFQYLDGATLFGELMYDAADGYAHWQVSYGGIVGVMRPSALDGSVFIVGTTSNHQLDFWANGSSKWRVRTDGVLAGGGGGTDNLLLDPAAGTSTIKAKAAVNLDLGANNTAFWRIKTTGELAAQGGNRQIQNVQDPTLPQDAATKTYVDWQAPVPNMVINGNMMMWQRTGGYGTTEVDSVWNAATLLADRTFLADRWWIFTTVPAAIGGADTYAYSQQPATSEPDFDFCARVRIKTKNAGTTWNSADSLWLAQELDRGFVKSARGKKVSITVRWRKGSAMADDGHIKLISQTGDARLVYNDGGQWGYNNTMYGNGPGPLPGSHGTGIYGGYTGAVDVMDDTTANASIGTTFTTHTATSSVIVPVDATAMILLIGRKLTTNPVAGVNQYMDVSRVRLVMAEAAPVDFAFAGGSEQSEIQLCQRYFEKSSDGIAGSGIAPNSPNGSFSAPIGSGSMPTVPYKVQKVNFWNGVGGFAKGNQRIAVYPTDGSPQGSITNITAVTEPTVSVIDDNTWGFHVERTGGGAAADAAHCRFHWAADYEI